MVRVMWNWKDMVWRNLCYVMLGQAASDESVCRSQSHKGEISMMKMIVPCLPPSPMQCSKHAAKLRWTRIPSDDEGPSKIIHVPITPYRCLPNGNLMSSSWKLHVTVNSEPSQAVQSPLTSDENIAENIQFFADWSHTWNAWMKILLPLNIWELLWVQIVDSLLMASNISLLGGPH